MERETVIELMKITAYRGSTRVFEGLTLKMERGRSTVILGPNGAGKSTLLKLLTRELYPVQKEGSYLKIFGRDLWNIWDLRSRLGIVSNDLHESYSGRTSGSDVVLSGLYSSIGTWSHQSFTGFDRERAAVVMKTLGVEELSARPFSAMSTGQQRRFLLGRALINDPEVLVLDEPAGGLDINACFHYMEIIRGLMASGTTVLLVTHHIHEIPPEMERVVLLKGGNVINDGPKAEVLTDRSLGALFDTPVRLVRHNGFYQAFPG